MRNWISALLAVFALGATVAEASLPETPRFRYFGVAEGLPSRVVYAVRQDREGYLWFATGDGLARFDGQDWDVYRHDPADPDSIPGNAVLALEVDAHNQVWMGLEGQGLARLSADRQRFEHLHGEHEEAFAGPYVWAIRETPDGAIWVGTFQDGLFRRDPDGSVSRFLPEAGRADGLPSDVVLSMDVDADGRLWVATSHGAAAWNGQGFDPIDLGPASTPLVSAIGIDDQGRPWFGQRGLLHRLDAQGRLRRYEVSGNAHGVVDIDEGLQWVASDHGMRVLDHGVERDHAYGHPELARAALQQLMRDREGSLWLVGIGGVWQLAPGWQRFASFRVGPPGDAQGLSNEFVRGVAESADGGLWLGGQNGLDHLDLATARVRRADGHGYGAGAQVWSLAAAADGTLWIGRHRALARFVPGTGELTEWRRDDDDEDSDVLAGPVDLLHIDPRQRVWVGIHGGGIQVRERDGTVLHTLRPGDGQGLRWPDPEQIADGPDGSVWVADAAGLLRWDDATSRLQPVPGAPEDRVYTFARVEPGALWLHRFTALERYRFEGGALHLEEVIDAESGLPAVESGGLLVDGAGGLWLSTARGLLHRSVDGNLRLFGLRDGLPAQEFHTRPMTMTSLGIGVGLTQGGVLLFDPAFREPVAARLPVQVKGIGLRRDEASHVLDPDQPLVLRHDDRDLHVSVRLLSFVDPAAHRYRMRLSDHDPDWVSLGATGERTFSRLQPGRYRLDIQAADASGQLSELRTLSIEVLPPWWWSAWAWFGYLLLAILLASWAASVYRLRLKRRHALELAEQQRRLAEQASQAKTEFLATLGHEVRTPMTGVLGMSELLLQSDLSDRQRGQVDAIHRAGRHLLRLVNDALDLARIEAGKLVLERQPFRIRELIKEVCDLLQPLAGKKGLDFDCSFAGNLPDVVVGDQYRVRQILLNLGSNAIKFTGEGGVSIDAGCRGGHVYISVCDSGPGLNAEQRERLFQRFEQAPVEGLHARQGGSGLGLAISQELAAAMGGRITLQSSPGEGACFEVSLPLPEAQPSADDRDSGSPAVPPSSGPLDILLVEDDAIVAEVIQGLLQGLGHTVAHVPHGLAALSRLAGRPFDLALLDLDLPGLHGVELARVIRRQGHRLPLLAITARADADAEPSALQAGMDAFLRKPLTASVLADAIARLRREHTAG